MPEFHRHEKRVGLHSAVFRKSALQANGFWLASPRKPARTAKVRLVEANLRLVVSVAKKYVNGSLKSANILFSGPLRELFFRDLEALLVVLKAGCADEGRARNSSPPASPGR